MIDAAESGSRFMLHPTVGARQDAPQFYCRPNQLRQGARCAVRLLRSGRGNRSMGRPLVIGD